MAGPLDSELGKLSVQWEAATWWSRRALQAEGRAGTKAGGDKEGLTRVEKSGKSAALSEFLVKS